jgi:hypothetical protein
MSIHTPEPQSGPYPSEGIRNAKAEAKAAKAYAKAVRPWYKKKRVIIPACLVALVVAVSAGSGSHSASGSPSGTASTASENTSQVPQSAKPAAQETPVAKKKPEMTSAQSNAVASAKQYLEIQAFSKKGLIQQLSSSAGDGYPRADARFAVNYLHVDWNAQAVKAAREYLDMQSFSKSGLIRQLSSSAGSGFTPAQARYAVNKAY